MTALSFQTGGRHQTSLASLRGSKVCTKQWTRSLQGTRGAAFIKGHHSSSCYTSKHRNQMTLKSMYKPTDTVITGNKKRCILKGLSMFSLLYSYTCETDHRRGWKCHGRRICLSEGCLLSVCRTNATLGTT